MANIYEATFLIPNTSLAIDGQVDNAFTCLINAKAGVACVKYKVDIVLNSDSTSVYTQTVTLTSDNYVYDGETLSFTVPSSTLTNGVEYKWYITVYSPSDLTTGVVSDEILIITNEDPVITFTPPSTITERKYTFSFTYSQAEDVALSYFTFNLYGSDGSLIESSDSIYGGRTEYEFSGFLNDNTYSVEVVGETVNNVTFDSGREIFTVSYSGANITTKPTVTQDSETSLVTVNIGDIVQNTGVANGTYSFINDFVRQGNKALRLESGSSVYWNINIPTDFTGTVLVKKISGTGKIVELESIDGKLYTIGYQGGSFYMKNDVYIGYTDALALPTSPFVVAIRPQDVWIITTDYTVAITIN